METKTEAVHVHIIDVQAVTEEYRRRGYVLLDRVPPTIAAQPGFVKLIFVQEEPSHKVERQNKSRYRLL